MGSYVRAKVRAPKLSGTPLRMFVAAIESAAGEQILKKLVTDSGLELFRASDPGDASPIQMPLPRPTSVVTAVSRDALAEAALACERSEPRLETVAAYRQAYTSGATDPVVVVTKLERHIAALDQGESRMAFFIARKPEEVLRQAEASRERHRSGKALSVLDGVPVVIKDELDMAGFPTTLGTTFKNEPATSDAAVVARLRAAGAILLGKANMHEIGINPIGVNPHHGACRNPYDRGRITGGSSSGSAASVAVGLAPIAIGADGGGSIRIPAALTGTVGLKATFGRIPESGVPPLTWNPGHVGPIGLTVADVAAAYAIIAGPDDRDPASWHQPTVDLAGLDRVESLEGVRLGISPPYFEDADSAVVARCKEALRACTDRGATIVEIPPPDLNTILWSHAVIILSEMASAMLPFTNEDSSRFGADARTNLAIGRYFRATDLVHAMRHRHRITRQTLELLRGVDAIVTPTTATTAPPIPEKALPYGESNLPVVDELMRFIRIGNLTGFPAITVPAGYAEGLPIGVQFLGRPYEEALLFRLARVVERATPYQLPKVHVRGLP